MKIGTRGSALALWQARAVARAVAESGGPPCEIVVIRTSGDESATPPDPPLRPAAEPPAGENVKRAFVKEIEDALLDGRIDMAVHSAKDLPGQLPDGLAIAAALEREDPRDALLLPRNAASVTTLDALRAAVPTHGRVGTSSVRRAAALRDVLPGAAIVPIRGNVDTRLRKLDSGACDVLVLALAGLKRLGLDHRVSMALPIDLCVPAPGQGIVAIEIAHAAPQEVRDVVRAIGDADAEEALLAERAVVQALGGNCQMPLGAIAEIDGPDIAVRGMVCSVDGRRAIRATATGRRGGAAAVGEKLARQLLAKGAAELLK